MPFKNIKIVVLVFITFFTQSRADKNDTEHRLIIPWGYLGHCPGSTEPVIITEKYLKHLTLSVQGSGLPFLANRTTYGYNQMKLLAKNPFLDFKNKRTIMFIGGYTDHINYILARMMGSAYNYVNYNVLLLNTHWFTTFTYQFASRVIRAVGEHVAEMLIELVAEGLDPSKMELIGQSLGAQTCAFVGKNFYKKSGKKLSRITGLDPSGSCFRNLGPEDRLDANDADFVDIVVVNADGFGTAHPIGHVNIYVNGGEYQPADFIFMPCWTLCSHSRAWSIWIASLLHRDKFIAMKCDDEIQARYHKCYDRQPLETNLLGPDVNKSNHGIFYLATGTTFPYFLGKEGLKRENMVWDAYLKVQGLDKVVKL